ncbi:Retrovirus-related Pol polyprotein from transposon TNT 1-94 [Linum perenne]
MSSDSDSAPIRFTGSNYSIWEYSFCIFVQGKSLLPFLDGSKSLPSLQTTSADEIASWHVNNAKVLSWLICSVEPAIAITFRSFMTAAEVWTHLRQVYSQVSTSRLFDLEYELATLSQGDRDIYNYYIAANQLWTDHDILTGSNLSSDVSAAVIQERKKSRNLQFLMKLRPEFETTRAKLIAQDTTDIQGIIAELTRTETRLRTQNKLDTAAGTAHTKIGFAATRFRPQFGSSNTRNLSNSGQQRQDHSEDMQCRFCGQKGHYQSHCRKRNMCNYCKKPGHIIVDCRLRQSRGSRPSTNRGAYAAAGDLGSVNGNSGGSDIDRMVQEALGRALPNAINAAFASVGLTGNSPTWYLDSASFNHMSGDPTIFRDCKPMHNSMVEVASGEKLPAIGIGTIVTPQITLPNTLYVPSLVPNLVSVGQLTDNGYDVSFGSSGCVIQDRVTKTRVGTGSKLGRTFHLDKLTLPSFVNSPHPRGKDFLSFSVQSDRNKLWDLWHSRLGHPNSDRLLRLFRKQLLPNSINYSDFHTPHCVSCIEAKMPALPFAASTTIIHDPFELIHTDLWGPAPITSRLGYRYFALFIDHHTRYAWIYFLRLKSELFSAAKSFVQMIQTQFGRTFKVIRSDPGGEFSSQHLHQFYSDNGILFQQSCPGVSEQNGLVERKHRHVLDLTRAILLQSRVPTTFWVEAVRTVVYLINRQPTPVLKHLSPFEILFHRPPAYSRLRVFGCTCFVLLPKRDRTKFSAKTARCVFLGYSDHHKGYLCYDPIQHRLHTAYHVLFLEHLFYYHATGASASPLGSPPRLPSFDDVSDLPATHIDEIVVDEDVVLTPTTPVAERMSSPDDVHGQDSPSMPGPAIPPPRQSSRSTQGVLPPRFSDFVTYSSLPVSIPTSYKQACGQPPWELAMNEELDALQENSTWEIVSRPTNAPVIGYKWVYTVKFHPDGSLDRHKARLVAQGYRQEYGIDYDETFAPVAKMQTVRLLLAVAAQSNWPLLQLDVKNSFLYGRLKETVFMECPHGFDKGSRDVVCLLKRSLYGLKQAPRAWFETFQQTILQSGFVQSLNDPSLFTKTSSTGITVLLIYVDDMIISGSDPAGIAALRQVLQDNFKMKELGDLSYFLGLEVTRSTRGILLTQRKYIDDLLLLARHTDCTPCGTPMEHNLKLQQEAGTNVTDVTHYHRLVGSLIYLVSTRPDIAYAVQVVSQFMGNPRQPHLQAVYHILRYLKGTRDLGMFFSACPSSELIAYANADFAGCLDTRRSTSGWCVKLGDSFISWRCKKQDRVAKSSTEAEYRSMSDVCSEVVWLSHLLADFGINPKSPAHLFGDNTSAIQIATNLVLHDRTKHTETHVHYIRDLVNSGAVQLFYITSDDQLADLLTKAVSTSRHWYLSGKLMMLSHHQFEGGC